MFTKLCENCGKEFETEYDYHFMCWPCWYDAMNARYMCHGTTKAGKPCRAIAKRNGYCFMHRNQAPRPDAVPVNSNNWLYELVERQSLTNKTES